VTPLGRKENKMIQWKDASSWSRGEEDRSQPKTWQATIGIFRVLVHRHIHYPANDWLASYEPRVLPMTPLSSRGIDEAKREAVAKLMAVCEAAIKAMDE